MWKFRFIFFLFIFHSWISLIWSESWQENESTSVWNVANRELFLLIVVFLCVFGLLGCALCCFTLRCGKRLTRKVKTRMWTEQTSERSNERTTERREGRTESQAKQSSVSSLNFTRQEIKNKTYPWLAIKISVLVLPPGPRTQRRVTVVRILWLMNTRRARKGVAESRITTRTSPADTRIPGE